MNKARLLAFYIFIENKKAQRGEGVAPFNIIKGDDFTFHTANILNSRNSPFLIKFRVYLIIEHTILICYHLINVYYFVEEI